MPDDLELGQSEALEAQDTNPEADETSAEEVQPVPAAVPTPVPTGPSPLEQRLMASETASRELLNQILRQDAAKAPAQTGPEIPKDILEGATPIVKAILGPEIENLRSQVNGIVNHTQNQVEKGYILQHVPNFEQIKGQIAETIHAELDQLGVPRDPAIRRAYFTPIAVVQTANALRTAHPADVSAIPASKELANRSVLEGRGAGTPLGTVVQSPDYSTMSDADFAKAEAKIAAQRMARNRG